MKEQQLKIKRNVDFKEINSDEVMNITLCSFNEKPTLLITTSDAEYQNDIIDGYNIMQSNNFLASLKLGCEISFKTYKQYAELLIRINRSLKIRTFMKEIQYSGRYTPDDVYDELFGRMTEEQILKIIPEFMKNPIPFIQDAIFVLSKSMEGSVIK